MLPVLLDPAKFQDALVTARGEARAHVALRTLETLWFNTGTLCNLTCQNCYTSDPRRATIAWPISRPPRSPAYLDEIERDGHGTKLIGFTGGEPFMNRDLPAMLEDVSRGLKAMVLTNAMKPMQDEARPARPAGTTWPQPHDPCLARSPTSGPCTRRSGARSWKPTIDGLVWLAQSGFDVHVAGRQFSEETEAEVRAGYARLFAELGIRLMRQARRRWCCFRRWTPASTFRRSRRPAGASSRSRPTA